MYRDALKALERKFGQPQAVVTAYLDKFANFPPVKMHNSESIISYSAIICSLVGVFRSPNYVQDLSSASLLGQAVQKLPPNMKEAWSMRETNRFCLFGQKTDPLEVQSSQCPSPRRCLGTNCQELQTRFLRNSWKPSTSRRDINNYLLSGRTESQFLPNGTR